MPSLVAILSFCVLAYSLTWLCWLPIAVARAGWIELPVTVECLATLGQFGPFVAAFLVAALDGQAGGVRGLLGRLVHWRVNPVWFAVVLILPPACLYAAILAHELIHGIPVFFPSFGEPFSVLPHLVLTLVVGGPLGEELGWRGFALPRLRTALHPIPASVLLGFIWAGWHLPLWWIADVPASFGLYVVGVIPLTYLFTWVADHTENSILLALLFHASLNTSLARLPVRPAWGEWTALLWFIALIVASFEWWRRSWPVSLDSATQQGPAPDRIE